MKKKILHSLLNNWIIASDMIRFTDVDYLFTGSLTSSLSPDFIRISWNTTDMKDGLEQPNAASDGIFTSTWRKHNHNTLFDVQFTKDQTRGQYSVEKKIGGECINYRPGLYRMQIDTTMKLHFFPHSSVFSFELLPQMWPRLWEDNQKAQRNDGIFDFSNGKSLSHQL